MLACTHAGGRRARTSKGGLAVPSGGPGDGAICAATAASSRGASPAPGPPAEGSLPGAAPSSDSSARRGTTGLPGSGWAGASTRCVAGSTASEDEGSWSPELVASELPEPAEMSLRDASPSRPPRRCARSTGSTRTSPGVIGPSSDPSVVVVPRPTTAGTSRHALRTLRPAGQTPPEISSAARSPGPAVPGESAVPASRIEAARGSRRSAPDGRRGSCSCRARQ